MTASAKSLDYLQMHVRAYANRIYQQDRWRILERRENAVKAASIVLGTAAFADVKGLFGAVGDNVAAWLVFVLVALNVFGLVFQWGAKARDAAKRSSEWTALERDMEAVGAEAADQGKLNTWRAKCAEIEAGEAAINERLMWLSLQRACILLDAKLVDPEPQNAQAKALKRFALWYALP